MEEFGGGESGIFHGLYAKASVNITHIYSRISMLRFRYHNQNPVIKNYYLHNNTSLSC